MQPIQAHDSKETVTNPTNETKPQSKTIDWVTTCFSLFVKCLPESELPNEEQFHEKLKACNQSLIRPKGRECKPLDAQAVQQLYGHVQEAKDNRVRALIKSDLFQQQLTLKYPGEKDEHWEKRIEDVANLLVTAIMKQLGKQFAKLQKYPSAKNWTARNIAANMPPKKLDSQLAVVRAFAKLDPKEQKRLFALRMAMGKQLFKLTNDQGEEIIAKLKNPTYEISDPDAQRVFDGYNKWCEEAIKAVMAADPKAKKYDLAPVFQMSLVNGIEVWLKKPKKAVG